jgi:hypothetical protein
MCENAGISLDKPGDGESDAATPPL